MAIKFLNHTIMAEHLKLELHINYNNQKQKGENMKKIFLYAFTFSQYAQRKLCTVSRIIW